MSWIDREPKARLASVYRSKIQPLEAQPLDEQRDPGGSYYRERPSEPLRPADFEVALDDTRAIGSTLDAFWDGSPWYGLGRRLAKLMRRMPRVESRSEVSSSVYEMF